jgi:predicted transcriptional regulator
VKERQRLKVFGDNVRRERCARGLTQDKLAELAEISTRNLQKVEAGELNILFTTVVRIQMALKCVWKNLMP